MTHTFFRFFSASSPQRCWFPLGACLLFLALAGCTPSAGTSTLDLTRQASAGIDAPEETVSEPDLPPDDGIPLSPQERAAMESTGDLDATLSADEKRLVELHFKFFVHKNRGLMERFLLRSEPYLPYVKHVFTSRGIPEDVAYLAYVESGFNANAVSRAGAGGMWQFMPYTGKKYNLRQDSWIDERRDPFKATHAAADYLLKLHEYFGDWLLAVAAYNAGEGKIGRALKGTQTTTFFDICRNNHLLDEKARLRDETQQYVPRLLAVAKIMRNLESLGFNNPDPKKGHSLAQVSVPAGADLRSLARAVNMPWEQFSALNSAYRRPVSPPHLQTVAYVPFDRETQAQAWKESKEARLYAGWRDHKVRRGESLATIAKRTGVNTVALRRANDKSSDAVKAGDMLIVPGSNRAARATMLALGGADANGTKVAGGAGRGARGAGGYKGVHAVGSGDTLYALALRWGTDVDTICDLNNIEPSRSLQLGQSLYIPDTGSARAGVAAVPQKSFSIVSQAHAATQAATASARNTGKRYSPDSPMAARGVTVTVKPGDTLYSLARKHSVTIEDICKANGFGPSASLRVGQKLVIASAPAIKTSGQTVTDGRSQASKRVGSETVVKPGDTLSSIARENNTTVSTLTQINDIPADATLQLGQRIRLASK